MLWKNIVLLALVALLSASCAQKEKPPATPQPQVQTAPRKPPFYAEWFANIPNLFPKKKAPPSAAPPQWAGTIRMVNAGEKFVLIESNSLSAIIPGETYTVIGSGSETASLRMTALREPPFLIADILSGSPSEGDKIYLPRIDAKPQTTPTPSPARPTTSPTPAPQGPSTATLPPSPEPTAPPRPTPKPKKTPAQIPARQTFR